jgi:hypothetical protein
VREPIILLPYYTNKDKNRKPEIINEFVDFFNKYASLIPIGMTRLVGKVQYILVRANIDCQP